MRHVFVIVLTTVACGLDVQGSATPGSVTVPDAEAPPPAQDGGGAPEDAGGVKEPACDRSKPWGPPKAIPEVSSPREEANAWLTPDELTMFLIIGNIGDPRTRDIFITRRATKDGTFGAPTVLAGVSSDAEEDTASLTPDGTLIFMSSRNGNADIWWAKPTVTGFRAPEPIAGINSPGHDENPYYVDGALYFNSLRNGGSDLFVARKTATGFAAPTLIPHVNSDAGEIQPVVTADEKLMVFASTRTPTRGQDDVWFAERAHATDDFGPPKHIEELSTDARDLPTWISGDGCTMLLSVDRPGGKGGRDIYRTTRQR